MFIKKLSDKHFRLGARTWTPPDRDEIYRQRYLASLKTDPSQEHAKSFELNDAPLVHNLLSSDLALESPSQHQLSNHQSVDHHDTITQTPNQNKPLSQLSTSHSCQSQNCDLDKSSLLSRSQRRSQFSNSQRRPSNFTESLNDAHLPIQTETSPSSSRSQSLPNSHLGPNSTGYQDHPDPHISPSPSTHHPVYFPPQTSDPHQLDSASQNARQSQAEYAHSCAQSDYGRDRLREAQEAYRLAKERYSKALNAVNDNHSQPSNLLEDSHSKFDRMSNNINLEHNNPLSLNNTHELDNTPNHPNPQLNDNLAPHPFEISEHPSDKILRQQAQEQTELHEQRLKQISERNREQAEMHEQKLKQISEMEALLAIREKQVEIRVKQLEEALEIERLKCQEYTTKAKELEEALESERLKCIEQIRIAQETADRTARESIQRAEEERKRQLEEFQKDSEEKQRLIREKCEAERIRLEQAQVQLEVDRKEEQRKEAEVRMLAEMEKLKLEDQVHSDQEAQAIAQEKERLAMRAQILERDRKKPPFQSDRRREELIASYQPMSIWDFDPLPGYVPPPHLQPFYPPPPMSPRIVPEAVKKAACAQKVYIEKLQKQKAEEEATLMMLKQQQLRDRELADHGLEKIPAPESTAPNHIRHEHNQNHWPTRPDELHGVDEPFRRTTKSLKTSHPDSIPDLSSLPHSTDKGAINQPPEYTSSAARERELIRIEELARRNKKLERLEDARVAQTRAALKEALESQNLHTGSHHSRKAEDFSAAHTRGAQAAAHFMAEQASSKTSRAKTPQISDPRNRRAVFHDHAAWSTAPVERALQHLESAFQLHDTDHVPGWAHEVVKPIESSAVHRVDHPSPIEYLKNDPRGVQHRLEGDQLARQALIAEAKRLGADAIVCLSHPSPVLVNHSRVNFSAKGVAVTLKTSSAIGRTGLDNYSTYPSDLVGQSHLHSKPEQSPTSHGNDEVPVTAATSPSIPFANSDSDEQSTSKDRHPTRDTVETFPSVYDPIAENHGVSASNNNTAHHGLTSFSIKSIKNHNDSGYKFPTHSHQRNHQSPRVIHEENSYSVPRVSERPSEMPIPPSYVTPKVMVQPPSDQSSLNESKGNLDSPYQKKIGTSFRTSADPFFVQGSSIDGKPTRMAEANTWPGANSVSSAESSPIKTSSTRVDTAAVASMPDFSYDVPTGSSDLKSSIHVTDSRNFPPSPTDLGSASRVTNTDFAGATESGTSSQRQTTPATTPRCPASGTRALSRIEESDQSVKKATAKHPHVSSSERSPSSSSIIQPPIPSFERFTNEYTWGTTLDQDERCGDGYSDVISHQPMKRKEVKNPSSNHSMVISELGKLNSTSDVQTKSQKVLEDGIESTQLPRTLLTNNLIRSNSTLVSPSGSVHSLKKNEENERRSTHFIHPSPLSKELSSSENSSTSQGATIIKNRSLSSKKCCVGLAKKDQTMKRTKRGNRPRGVKSQETQVSLTSSEESEGKSYTMRSTDDQVHSAKSYAMDYKDEESDLIEKKLSSSQKMGSQRSMKQSAKSCDLTTPEGFGEMPSPPAKTNTRSYTSLVENVKKDSLQATREKNRIEISDKSGIPETSPRSPTCSQKAFPPISSLRAKCSPQDIWASGLKSKSVDKKNSQSAASASTVQMSQKNSTVGSQVNSSTSSSERMALKPTEPFWEAPNETAASPLLANMAEYLLSRPSRSTTPMHFDTAVGLNSSDLRNQSYSSPVYALSNPSSDKMLSDPYFENYNEKNEQDEYIRLSGKQNGTLEDNTSQGGFDWGSQNTFKALEDPIVPMSMPLFPEIKSSSNRKIIDSDDKDHLNETDHAEPWLVFGLE